MAKNEKARMNELVDQLHKMNLAYYQKDQPIVSDAEYDQLLRELEKIEADHPDWKRADSPTQRVGAEAVDYFEKVSHRQPMLSIANSMDQAELEAFDERVRKQLNEPGPIEYLCELKFDGLSINLTYEGGVLKHAVTRGDGNVGENVTANIRTIKNVPLKLLGEFPDVVEIRGEIVLPISSFQELNRVQEESGEKVFANPRNAAAGSVRQLDSKITAQRDLKLFSYSLGYWEGAKKPLKQSDVLKLLQTWGFEVYPLHRLCAGSAQIQKFYEEVNAAREDLDFDIDGMVVKVNRLDWVEELGFVSRSPRAMTAYKFPPRQEITKILDIIVQVGRTGVLSPVAVLEPVNVHGVMVGRAALHNQEEIERKDIRLGDWVLVQRAGDVIPEVVSVLKEKRTGKEKLFKIPSRCPSCGSAAVKVGEEVAVRCLNEECPAQNQEALEHFVSKGGMDIVGLGPRILHQLVQEGLVKRYSDLYLLTVDKIVGLEGFQEKSAAKLIAAIEKSKTRKLSSFIYALGIRHVGERLAISLARGYPNIKDLMGASVEELLAVEDVGETVAQSIVEYFSKKKNVEEIQRLLQLNIQLSAGAKASSQLIGKTFVITGTLEGISRQEAAEWIESRGGKVSSSVSKKTSYLLAGEEAGSKLDKARELGVPVIAWTELQKLGN